jgi:hypothetical protein
MNQKYLDYLFQEKFQALIGAEELDNRNTFVGDECGCNADEKTHRERCIAAHRRVSDAKATINAYFEFHGG